MTTKQIAKALGKVQSVEKGSNCYVYHCKNGIVLQSYRSMVAVRFNSGKVVFGKWYDYSATTRKQICKYIGMHADARRAGVADGYIQVLEDLDKLGAYFSWERGVC